MSQDIQPPFDPTGYASISSAQLYQLVSGLTFVDDKGAVITTEDIAGNAQVPDPRVVGEDKLAFWLWRRVSAGSVALYIWNKNGAIDATMIKWVSVATALPAGSVGTSVLADLAVTNAKILSVDWSKITGVPAISPSGAAGGDLTGNYPNPEIKANGITSAKLSSDAAVDANRAVGENHIKNNAVDITKHLKVAGATGLSILRVNAGGTAGEIARAKITEVANPAPADAGKIVRVNSAGDAFEKVAQADAGSGMYQLVAKSIPVANTNGVGIPDDNTVPQISEGVELASVTITPKSATSLLRFRLTGFLTGSVVAPFALFKNGTNNALCSTRVECQNANYGSAVCLEYVMASPGAGAAVTFSVRWSSSSVNVAYFGGNSIYGGTGTGMFTVEEVVGTLS